ncbi:MAG TPA: phosphatase PAP2 family protein [Pyrinomonadaceae bacterium]|jgi:undecaprenyl-diphosphatase
MALDDSNPAGALAPEVAAEQTARPREVRRLWRAEVIYGVALAGFAVLALFAHLYTYFAWDLAAKDRLQTLDAPALLAFMQAVSIFGNGWRPFALSALTIILLLLRARRSEAAGLTLSVAGGSLLNYLIKLVIARPRPDDSLVEVFVDLKTESFPSGHVTFYVCYFGFLFFMAFALLPHRSTARRLALVLTTVPIALVGLSRIYLGAHWPSDTLGAYLMSGLWLAFSLSMYRRWKGHATFHPEEPPVADPSGEPPAAEEQ